jgi:hypothetical protein
LLCNGVINTFPLLGSEAEESPLLEAIARELLVKMQEAGKGLVGAVVIYGLNPIYSHTYM